MEQDYRMMSAMVVYSLERSLSNFVADAADIEELPQDMIQTVVQRELASGRNIKPDTVSNLLEATYISEVFDFASICTKDTSQNDHVEYLRNLSAILGLFGIRNAVSHPNRPFLENYWHRVATIASDPVIAVLGLEDVLKTFQSAKEGKLTPPPDEWYHDIEWVVPNNLPNTFDHDITGLVGRATEIREIREALKNPRLPFIALVAPGGFGKTALALEVMKDVSLTPSSRDLIDAIVFVSLKTEKLTSEGLQKFNAPSSISEIKNEITNTLISIYELEQSDFDTIKEELEKQSVLLLVDNLETVLRDAPADFLKFNMSLPPTWRVIVTSRVTVDSAWTIPISPLNKNSSIHLAREYGKKRGLQRLDNETLETIATQCNYNPLAIRLSIDLYALGKPVPESTGIAKEEIAKFSYDNLVDSLSHRSLAILECLFNFESATRSDLMDLLELNMDEVAESIAELTKTSLVHRRSSTDEELYSISSSVRDLLLVNPRNLAVRQKISEQLRKRQVFVREQQAIQREQGISRFDKRYIPEDAPPSLKLLLHEANKIVWKRRPDHRSLANLHKRFDSLQAQFTDSVCFHTAFSIVLSHLKDYQGSRRHLLKAVEIGPEDPTIIVQLARLEHTVGSYAEAEQGYYKLLNKGFDDPEKSNINFARNLLIGYFLALLYQGKYDDILRMTKSWKTEKYFRALYGGYRAGAWRRSVEKWAGKDYKEFQKGMHSAMQIMDDVVHEDGYSKTVSIEIMKIIDDIQYQLMNEEGVTFYDNYSLKFLEESLNFAAKHLFEIDTTNWSNEERSSIAEKLSSIRIHNNPFADGRWMPSEIQGLKSGGEDLEALGYILVKVYHIPNTGGAYTSFLFAKDDSESQYYLNKKQLTHSNEHDWETLRIGSRLWILPGQSTEPGKANNAADIRIL